MKKALVLLALSILTTTSAWAIDKSNSQNVEDLKAMIFAENSPVGTVLIQKGKSSDGEDCVLKMTTSRYGVSLSLIAGPEEKQDRAAAFRASISAKTSTQYEVTDSDENRIEVSQVAMSADERGSYADRQTLKMMTSENPGAENNVDEITISSQFTSDWTDGTKGRSTPIFKDAQVYTLTCTF
ncbi:MAG: hypothetical protein ACXWQQ_16390 [Pseudobdellovibrio sp.]